MAKKLKAQYPENCIGCEMCVMECQRQLNKVGTEQSLIRILKTKKPNSEYPSFNVDMDPRINKLDIISIKKSCPTDVFDTVEESENEF